MLLMIDNYCYFTYKQLHYFGDLGVDVKLSRNDTITLADIERMRPQHWLFLLVLAHPMRPAFHYRLY